MFLHPMVVKPTQPNILMLKTPLYKQTVPKLC